MDKKFIPTLRAGNGYTYLKLQGILDEDNLLTNLLSQIQGKLLLIDMSEIERINSCGVRDWVNWLNQIQALGVQIILLKCSPCVVGQANMVNNFSADAFIHSFYAPYVNPDTGAEQNVLLFTEQIRQKRPIVAPKIFDDAGQELEFDEFEESYFSFINDPRIMQFQVPANVVPIIQYFVPEVAQQAPVLTSKPNTNVLSQYAQQLSGINATAVPSPSPVAMPPKPQAQVRHSQPPLPQQQYQKPPAAVPAAPQPPQAPAPSAPAAPPVPAAPAAPASPAAAPAQDQAANSGVPSPLQGINGQQFRIILGAIGIFCVLLLILIIVIIVK